MKSTRDLLITFFYLPICACMCYSTSHEGTTSLWSFLERGIMQQLLCGDQTLAYNVYTMLRSRWEGLPPITQYPIFSCSRGADVGPPLPSHWLAVEPRIHTSQFFHWHPFLTLLHYYTSHNPPTETLHTPPNPQVPYYCFPPLNTHKDINTN